MTKVTSAEEYKLVSVFQTLRKTLLQEGFADRLERPLAYWALTNDRRLPLALLGRTLDDLLKTPFEELIATPGIGQKKITTLVKLLARATRDKPPTLLNEFANEKKRGNNGAPRDESVFDPTVVSESLWEQWRETVRRNRLGAEKLGHLAPSLLALPTVIWHTPLETYLDHTLAEIRQLRTHGEKRVRTILEVFHSVNQALAKTRVLDHLAVRLTPRFVMHVEPWIAAMLESRSVPTDDALRTSLVTPLVEQLLVDAGPTVTRLAEGRLGFNGDWQTVRQQSRRMGVTRARVYQLLEECTLVMAVRWPDGRGRLETLRAHLASIASPGKKLELLQETIELFFADAEILASRSSQEPGELHRG